jgi:hypothetical protein
MLSQLPPQQAWCAKCIRQQRTPPAHIDDKEWGLWSTYKYIKHVTNIGWFKQHMLRSMCPSNAHLEVIEAKYMDGCAVADGVKAGIVGLWIQLIVLCYPPLFALQALVTTPLCPLTLHYSAVASSCMAVRCAVTDVPDWRQASLVEPANAMLCFGGATAFQVLGCNQGAEPGRCPGKHRLL